jgi:uncharacterized protein YcbX
MKVHSLHIYPMKSARVIHLSQAEIGEWGLAGDRRYMITDPDGKFITQRELQALAQITVLETDDALYVHKSGLVDGVLATFDTARRLPVDIWGSHVSAAVADDSVNATLSDWFGKPVKLVHADAETRRQCNPDWAGEGVETGFADGYPVLITTTGSLRLLNEATMEEGAETFGMDRFRPNIVIDHGEPFADDFWGAVEIAGIRFDLVKPCARCIMTTQDQLTGERGGPDPMPSMRKLRMSTDRRVPGVLFGWNAVPRGTGSLKIGDPVSVVAERPEGWPVRLR